VRKVLKYFPKQLRVLPLLIVVASLAFVVRIGDAALQVRSLSGAAEAAEESDAKKSEDASAEASGTQPPAAELKDAASDTPKAAEEKTAEKEKNLESTPSSEEEKGDAAKKEEAPKEGDPKKWSDASETESDYSTVRKEMYQDLLQRRQQLDAKEKLLSEREALLEAGQKELDRKFQELSGLRDEIQELLKTQSKEEEARISSLVKIYEGMKPKDAARIFNTLDMDVLLQVVSRMGERKSGAILAAMEADRAKMLTTLLAEQKTLPDVPFDSPEVPTP
jgi:flagellar motility protein MotE (MotC chaperone)